MKFHIRGDKKSGAKSLCNTCDAAEIIQGHAESERHIFCSRIGPGNMEIKFPVATCTEYNERGQMALYDMRESAWKVRKDSTGRFIGFVRPKERNDDE